MKFRTNSRCVVSVSIAVMFLCCQVFGGLTVDSPNESDTIVTGAAQITGQGGANNIPAGTSVVGKVTVNDVIYSTDGTTTTAEEDWVADCPAPMGGWPCAEDDGALFEIHASGIKHDTSAFTIEDSSCM